MRRSSRMKKSDGNSISDKIILYTLIGIAVLALIVFAILMYSKNINDEVKDSTMTLEQMAKASENEDETQSTGTEIGKSVNEVKEENNTNSTNTNSLNAIDNSNTINTSNTSNTQNTSTNTTPNVTNETNANTTNNAETQTKETKKELSFQKPVEGDIVREYAKDNLIYSNTLEEWTTHLGIDIKADKTTVVKSAEAGTVKSIKNDPRYGLTVVVEHTDNFQTIYSNLLTSEFVVEGETIEKGQAIGTVGNTAVFEIADEPHLHFEILKDNIQVDPSIYIK